MSGMNLLTESRLAVAVDDLAFDVSISVPDSCAGLVVLARAGGGDGALKRCEAVSAELLRRDFATALVDLLTGREAREPEYKYDAHQGGRRLAEIVRRVQETAAGSGPLGILGAGAAAAACIVASESAAPARAFVSLGGRPEFAGLAIDALEVPALFIVGGHDWGILVPNEEASERVKGPARLAVVPLATRFFEEEGTLDEAAHLAAEWFRHWLVGPGGDASE